MIPFIVKTSLGVEGRRRTGTGECGEADDDDGSKTRWKEVDVALSVGL